MSQRLFRRYKLVETIGVGGMAEVHKAQLMGDRGFSKTVALKMTHPQFSQDKFFLEAFEKEAKLISSINHPNIVQILDFGSEEGIYYIAMEYIRGKDLKSILSLGKEKKVAIPPGLGAFIISLVCQGLAYAHNLKDHENQPLNLVHRDISPHNILISYDGCVKVIDFGIAKVSADHTLAEKTQAGIIKGKVAYMSPEQAEGTPLDRRSDIFSLGIVFYELVTGKNPFLKQDPILTLERIRKAEYMNTSDTGIQVPENLESIVKKCLEKDPDARYQTADELGRELEAYLHNDAVLVTRRDIEDHMKRLFPDSQDPVQGPAESSIDESSIADFPPSRPPPEPAVPQAKVTNWEKILPIGGAALVVLLFLLYMVLPAGTGKIIIETTPKDAQIFFNGEKIADSGPVIKEKVTINEPQKIEVVAHGYKKWSKTFILEGKGGRTFDVILERNRGRIKVTTVDAVTLAPISTNVHFDNKTVGVSPVTINDVDLEANHELTLALEGYETLRKSITYSGAEKLKIIEDLTVNLFQNTGLIEIKSKNEKVMFDIFLNEEKIGQTPLKQGQLLIGTSYKIRASAPGYQDYLEEIELSDSKMTPLFIPSLKEGEHLTGLLSINSSPWSEVYINQEKMGSTPLLKLKLEPGSYAIKLVNPNENLTKVLELSIQGGREYKKFFRLR